MKNNRPDTSEGGEGRIRRIACHHMPSNVLKCLKLAKNAAAEFDPSSDADASRTDCSLLLDWKTAIVTARHKHFAHPPRDRDGCRRRRVLRERASEDIKQHRCRQVASPSLYRGVTGQVHLPHCRRPSDRQLPHFRMRMAKEGGRVAVSRTSVPSGWIRARA